MSVRASMTAITELKKGSPFDPPPDPKSDLGRYRLLAPNAAVKVSPLCLGAMNFGDAWKDMMGECRQETAEQILDYYYDNGGNFIDTANNYQNEESEKWLGEWMKKRGNRDQMVIATKFTSNFRMTRGAEEQIINFAGNGTKSLHVSVERSLEKLQTSYIDLLYVHWWDFATSIPELMTSLNYLVASRKVLYLGISDTPAYVVAQCNAYARHHSLRPFSVYQGLWSAEHRDFEREIIPMCISEGMGICPWGALGRGHFKTAAEHEKLKATGDSDGRKMGPPSEKAIEISAILENIAASKGDGVEITSIAIAYVMQKTPFVFPIIGCRTLEHLKGNMKALKVALTPEEIDEIEGAVEFDVGFPMAMLGYPWPNENFMTSRSGRCDFVEPLKAIVPKEMGKVNLKFR